MRNYWKIFAIALVCIVGCDESTQIEGRVDAEKPGYLRAVLIKDLEDEHLLIWSEPRWLCVPEPCFDAICTVANSLVTKRNFRYKLDDADSRLGARVDVRYLLDICAVADSECARTLENVRENDRNLAHLSVDEMYKDCGDYLNMHRQQNERYRVYIKDCVRAVSLIRKAVVLYQQNKADVVYTSDMISFKDLQTQKIWSDIIDALDVVETLPMRHYGRLWLWHPFEDAKNNYSNAFDRCMSRLKKVDSEKQAAVGK